MRCFSLKIHSAYFFLFVLFVSLQRMPPEPRLLSDVRSALEGAKESLEKMVPQTQFCDFLSSEALPQLVQQVGSHAREVLHTILDVLHLQCEVSKRLCSQQERMCSSVETGKCNRTVLMLLVNCEGFCVAMARTFLFLGSV